MQLFSVLALLVVAIVVQVSAFVAPARTAQRISTRRNLFGSEPPKNTPAKTDDKGGGMFGGMGNIMESMKKAQEIAKQAESANKELSEARVTGKDPSGQVEALFNGLGVPIEMKVSDSICSQGGDAVSVACTQAVNDAYLKSRNVMMARMQQVYSGMELK